VKMPQYVHHIMCLVAAILIWDTTNGRATMINVDMRLFFVWLFYSEQLTTVNKLNASSKKMEREILMCFRLLYMYVEIFIKY
jgi:hypothetical protein